MLNKFRKHKVTNTKRTIADDGGKTSKIITHLLLLFLLLK